MKTILKHTAFTAILLSLAGGLISCEKENPVEIPFTEYSLVGTSCQWKNLNYDNKLIIINSNKDLEKYVNCMDGDSYPEIDFSKHTLLLANGRTHSNVNSKNIVHLTQYSSRKYDLEIVVRMGTGGLAEAWTLAILVPKVSSRANVTLKIEYTH